MSSNKVRIAARASGKLGKVRRLLKGFSSFISLPPLESSLRCSDVLPNQQEPQRGRGSLEKYVGPHWPLRAPQVLTDWCVCICTLGVHLPAAGGGEITGWWGLCKYRHHFSIILNILSQNLHLPFYAPKHPESYCFVPREATDNCTIDIVLQHCWQLRKGSG